MASRGRGGRGPNMLKGATFEYDKEARLDVKPNELFPKHPNLQTFRAPSEKEARVLRNYRALQTTVQSGPFYTHPTKRDTDAPAKTFSEEQLNKQYGVNAKADFDPFNGVETYSKKYDQPKHTMPRLNNVTLDRNFFPKELWDVLGGDSGEQIKAAISRAQEKKNGIVANGSSTEEVDRKVLELLKVDEDDDDADPDDMSDEGEEEPQDDDFEDDEDGGDYNAEQYFDDGEGGEDDGDDGPGDDY